MKLNLPQPITAYFDADKRDGDAVAECFSEDAVVKDEGHTYVGRASIRQWKADASARYEYTVEPVGCEQNDGRYTVSANVVGNFPGSPVVLRFLFGLEGDRIASLEVRP